MGRLSLACSEHCSVSTDADEREQLGHAAFFEHYQNAKTVFAPVGRIAASKSVASSPLSPAGADVPQLRAVQQVRLLRCACCVAPAALSAWRTHAISLLLLARAELRVRTPMQTHADAHADACSALHSPASTTVHSPTDMLQCDARSMSSMNASELHMFFARMGTQPASSPSER
eukprot:6191088-Pleurochrysis_carterae.AAC.4